MNCDKCVFYIPSLKTCMFCNFINKDDKHNGSCSTCTCCTGEWVDENHFIPSCDNTPRCEGQEKEWDILKLDDEEDFCAEWSHKKILKRLHNHGIDCFFVDIWGSDEIAFITGITGLQGVIVPKVARVLGIHEECIYYDWEHDFMILNLFQEKILRQECKCGDY